MYQSHFDAAADVVDVVVDYYYLKKIIKLIDMYWLVVVVVVDYLIDFVPNPFSKGNNRLNVDTLREIRDCSVYLACCGFSFICLFDFNFFVVVVADNDDADEDADSSETGDILVSSLLFNSFLYFVFFS